VPEGATTGPITIGRGLLKATSSSDFTVIPEQEVISLPAFGGWYYDSDSEYYKPCYWIGTERTDLPLGEYEGGYAVSPTVMVGTTVYVAGGYNGGDDGWMDVPCYWAGSTLQPLHVPAEASWSRTVGIAVNNGVIYTAGFFEYEDEMGYHVQPCYWEGTELKLLSIPEEGDYSGGWAGAITISNDTIYISGSIWNDYDEESACYWEITAGEVDRIDLPAADESGIYWANAIAVSGDTVYTAGSYEGYGGYGGYVPCYWTNTDEPVALTEPLEMYEYRAEATSIAVSGGSVYIGLMETYYDEEDNYISSPWYWKDGVRTDLLDPDSNDESHFWAVAMSVIGDIVYSGGYSSPLEEKGVNATYWTGETPVIIDESDYDSMIVGGWLGMAM